MKSTKISHLKKLAPTVKLILALAAICLGLSAGARAQTANNIASAPGATYAGLISDSAGNLYGTSFYGGNSQNCKSAGCGSVFELSPSGSSWTQTVLYSFSGQPDGKFSEASLVFDKAGNLYGTTLGGGNGPGDGLGVVFRLSPSSGGIWKETVLHAFSGTDGASPVASLVFDSKGNLYGTASYGGANGDGTFFKLLHTSGGNWKTLVLHNFRGNDGANPRSPLILDSAGNLYGTTTKGGTYSSGIAFKFSAASGTWKETVLHNFTGANDGQFPAGGLTFDSAGNLYGTTQLGGKYPCGGVHCGVVFRLSPSGSRWRESVLHNFTNASDGSGPSAGVIFDSTGNLWGTTNYGPGACMFECGQVFQLKPTSSGWTIGAVYPTPNSLPSFGGLIRDAAGNLYGTVTDDHCLAYGNVFELTP